MDEVAFGRYRLLGLIGAGGMGTVYRAHDSVIVRDVAIKVLSSELGAAPGYRERFRREAHTVARLTEPHIIPIYDTGEVDGQLYLVMPIIDGTDVQTLLERDGPMTPRRAVRVVEQLAMALDAAHKRGLVHRDVKPSNALITGDDFVYLIDFGIAHDAAATRVTNTGTMMGTLAYMAPERFTTDTADARSDIYALACVLYECLTGTTPYHGDSAEQQIAGHLALDPPQPSSADSTIPVGFDKVITVGMDKKPENRYQSARELAAAAQHALTAVRTPARDPHAATALHERPPPPTPPTPRPATPSPAGTHHDVPLAHPPADGTVWPHLAHVTNRADHPPPYGATPLPPRRASTAPPPPSGHHTTQAWPLIAAGIVILLIAGIAAYIAIPIIIRPPSSSPVEQTPAPAPQTPTAARSSTTLPIAQGALEGLLLSPAQINTAMSGSGMVVLGTTAALVDTSADVADKTCLPMQGPAEATVYTGSGWSAVRGQALKEPGNPWIHGADQYVILFSSAHDATAFLTASAQNWPACANRQYTVSFPGQPDHVVIVGPISNIDGTLSSPQTFKTGSNGIGSCQRALTVANNVAIDVATCFNDLAAQSDAAIDIAHQIAAKVAT